MLEIINSRLLYSIDNKAPLRKEQYINYLIYSSLAEKKKLTAAVFIELSIALGTVDSSIYLKKN